MRWTRVRAKIAITTERHVDIKLRDAKFDRSAIRGEHWGFFLGPLLGCHIDAIHWAGTNALTATNTIFNLVEEPHARTFRQHPFLVRVLHRASPNEQVLPGNPHAQQHS